ncbi:MAG: hypothetical protein QMD05_03470 [Candidatus Brocadiaceae bacterium]|nr:hypothetical protein [Candidatus Brocadiaceae bacterium]
MERTESIVVQASPQYENNKSKEMELFGWNLQNRQEIHEKGDAYGRPSYISGNTYITKTTIKHYVKLHFVRGLSLPNLDKIKKIETEYLNLPFPPSISLVLHILTNHTSSVKKTQSGEADLRTKRPKGRRIKGPARETPSTP